MVIWLRHVIRGPACPHLPTPMPHPRLPEGGRTSMTLGRLDCRTTTGQLQDNYRAPTPTDRAPANMQHDYTECRFCSILCRKRTLIENKNVEFLFCNFGNACTCCVGVVCCEGNRINHRTSTACTGQLQDNYRTLSYSQACPQKTPQDTVLPPSDACARLPNCIFVGCAAGRRALAGKQLIHVHLFCIE